MLQQLKHVESYGSIPGGGRAAAAAARGGDGARVPDDTTPRQSRGQQRLGLVHEEREGEDRLPLLPLLSNQKPSAGPQQQQLSHAGSSRSSGSANGGTRRLLLAAALLPAIPAGSPSSTPTAATLPAAQRRQAHTALHMRHKIAEREQY